MKLSVLVKALSLLFAGALLGIASAQWTIDRSATAMLAGQGPWKSWFAGSQSSRSPYVNAHYLMFGRLPPALGQELIFEAEQDEEGALLDSGCQYVVSGARPTARWWQLTVAGEGGLQAAAAHPEASISSARYVGEPDGTMRITFAREPQPGNWVDPGDVGRFSLVLKLRPGSGSSDPAAVVALPRIRRGECA